MNATPINFSFDSATLAKGFDIDKAAKSMSADELVSGIKAMGFSMDESVMKDAKYVETLKGYAADAALALGDANIPAYIQFFQYFRPEVIKTLYRGRTAKQAFGVDTMGDWTTEQIVAQTLEYTGSVAPYDDFSMPPLTSYNIGWIKRGVARFEIGTEVTKLEEAIAAKMRQNAKQLKHDAAILNIDIFENDVFWRGLNNGVDKVYGVLNEPGLPAATTAAVDPMDDATTVKQIQSMINGWIQKLATNLQGNLDVSKDKIRLLLPLAWSTALSIATDQFGWSAKKWLEENYKNVEISFHVELDTAGASGQPLAMVFAPEVAGVGMKTISLMQTSALRLIGAIPTLKGYQEAYSGSVAGALVACPLAVLRYEAPTT